MSIISVTADYYITMLHNNSVPENVSFGELLALNGYITVPPASYVREMHFMYLRSKYPDEYLILLSGHSLAALQKELKMRALHKKMLDEFLAARKVESVSSLQAWFDSSRKH